MIKNSLTPPKKSKTQNTTVQADNNIKVYPNPTTGLLNIELNEGEFSNGKFIVYSMLGSKLIEHKIEEGGTIKTLNLEKLKTGLYLYLLISDNGREIGNGKIIISE